MSSVGAASLVDRIGAWFGVDDPWQRPKVPIGRSDVLVAAGMFVLCAINNELFRPLNPVGKLSPQPVWAEYLLFASACALLIACRVRPTLVCLLVYAHFMLTYTIAPQVGFQVSYQAILFYSIYNAMAWARERLALLVVIMAISVIFLLWVLWNVLASNAADAVRQVQDEGLDSPSILGTFISWTLFQLLWNTIYVVGAVLLGRAAWQRARAFAQVSQQSETIRQQAAGLQRQAVVNERLRIARELHDVVAHHVSLMGIQAGAAKAMLTKDPKLSGEALEAIEEASQHAVTEMRGLLGALRSSDTELSGGREPEPTLAQIPHLIEQVSSEAFSVNYQLVADSRLAETVPMAQQLSVYRIVQEALVNVQRHSTANRASVVVRITSGPDAFIEAEILDDGRPRVGTSGSGLGQLGMRERVASHGGTIEVGPRRTGGYRVRVRLPLSRRVVAKDEVL